MFREHFTYNVEFLSLAGGAGTAFTDNTLAISSDADFEIKRTIHYATSNIANLKIQDLKTGRFLFKTQEDLRAISGTALSSITPQGFVPYNWPTPYKIDRNKQIRFSVADNSGSTNTIRMALHGEHLWDQNPYSGYDPTEKRAVMPMVYESPVLTTAAPLNSKINGVLKIDDDADFICTKITGQVTGDGLVSMVTQSSMSMHWQNIPTDINNFIGNSQFPHILSSPRFIPRNSTVYMEFTNLTVSANSLTIQLHGFKRF